MVIHGPSSANWDIDMGPVGLTDWYHKPAFEMFYGMRTSPSPAQNGLINGLNTFNDSGKITGEKFEMVFTPGKKHRMRIINMSTDSHYKFSIDNHLMTVQAADFVAIEPYQTNMINLFIGMISSDDVNGRSTI